MALGRKGWCEVTTEQQRIAIAEWCGWERQTDSRGSYWYAPEKANQHKFDYHELPDYLNDLNAMWEAEEKLLTGDGWKDRLAKYSSKLMPVMHDTDFGRVDVAFKNDMVHLRYFTLHATASQRCEALLRTLGLWKDCVEGMDRLRHENERLCTVIGLCKVALDASHQYLQPVLNEPGRSVFWKVVEARNSIATLETKKG